MRIVWETTVYPGPGPAYCLVCGGRYFPLRARGSLHLLAVVYDDRGRVAGEACRDCARSTPEAVRAHLEERLARLRTSVRELEQLAEPIALPSLEEEFRAHS